MDFIIYLIFLFSAPFFNGGRNGQSLRRNSNQGGSGPHSPHHDPHFIDYLQRTSHYAMHGYLGTSHAYGELQDYQKAYLETLFAQKKNQYEMPLLCQAGILNHEYYVNPPFGLAIPYQGNPAAESVLPSRGSGGPMLQKERISHFDSMLRSSTGGSSGSWHSDAGINMEGVLVSSLLEDLKNKKTRSLELSDMVDDVVEFRYAWSLWLSYWSPAPSSCFEEFIVSHFVMQYGSVWEPLYSTEARNCYCGRKDKDIPKDCSSCSCFDN